MDRITIFKKNVGGVTILIEVDKYDWGLVAKRSIIQNAWTTPLCVFRKFNYTKKYPTYEKNIARVKSYYKAY